MPSAVTRHSVAPGRRRGIEGILLSVRARGLGRTLGLVDRSEKPGSALPVSKRNNPIWDGYCSTARRTRLGERQESHHRLCLNNSAGGAVNTFCEARVEAATHGSGPTSACIRQLSRASKALDAVVPATTAFMCVALSAIDRGAYFPISSEGRRVHPKYCSTRCGTSAGRNGRKQDLWWRGFEWVYLGRRRVSTSDQRCTRK